MYLDHDRTRRNPHLFGGYLQYWCNKFMCWRNENAKQCDAFVGQQSNCYLTSACVRYKGLTDDCEELTALRHFRDTYLAKQEGGQALIDEYYAIAPEMVEKISQRADASAIYAYIYERICNCLELIKADRLDEVTVIYTDMTKQIQKILA